MAFSGDPILIELNNNYCSSLQKWVKRKLGCTVESNSTIKTKEKPVFEKLITIKCFSWPKVNI